MKTIFNSGPGVRTPVVLLVGQSGTPRIADSLMRTVGTLVVGYHYDGQVVRRWTAVTSAVPGSAGELPLELAHGSVSSTVCDDLLILLRKLHRREHVKRIVVLLPSWLEPEPICQAINTFRVHVGPGYIDGPAARDVYIEAVVTVIDCDNWLQQALGADSLDNSRTLAEIVVGQAEIADVLVLTFHESITRDILRRLAPSARITVGIDRVDDALNHVEPTARRGQGRTPHDPILLGEPALEPDGPVALIEFDSQRPFHPQRLHDALDMLLNGVVRTWGRAFVANRLDDVMWIESAGGALRINHAGKCLAAMSPSDVVYIDPQRRALAAMRWNDRFGDRHSSLAVLACGGQPQEITGALQGALLSDEELSRPQDWPKYPNPLGCWYASACDNPLGAPSTRLPRNMHTKEKNDEA